MNRLEQFEKGKFYQLQAARLDMPTCGVLVHGINDGHNTLTGRLYNLHTGHLSEDVTVWHPNELNPAVVLELKAVAHEVCDLVYMVRKLQELKEEAVAAQDFNLAGTLREYIDDLKSKYVTSQEAGL